MMAAATLRRTLGSWLRGISKQTRFASSVRAAMTINSVETSANEPLLKVSWEHGQKSLYPHIFLRDNCQCPQCFNPTAKARLLDTAGKVDLNIKPANVSLSAGKDSLICEWHDGHVSVFDSAWLHERRFPENDAEERDTLHVDAISWDGSFANDLPFVDYNMFMEDDEAAYKHLHNLIVYGLSIIRNAPLASGVLFDIVKRKAYGYLKKTHYGDIFTVISKKDPNNLAYTAEGLPLHADLPFCIYQPGIQMLHCIEQSSGESSGQNQFCDGINAAELLRKEDPEAFDLLTKVKFMFNDVGSDMYGEYDLEYERPIIGLNQFGKVNAIHLNNQVRSSYINASAPTVLKSYQAYYKLMHTIHDEKNSIKYKMTPGDIACFDNRRVLHGRTGYDVRTTNRWLEGAYLDWDEVLSKFRVLRKNLGKQ